PPVSSPLSLHDALPIYASLAADPRTRVTLDTEFLGNHGELEEAIADDALWESGAVDHVQIKDFAGSMTDDAGRRKYLHPGQGTLDRKSTRLNSSHVSIS